MRSLEQLMAETQLHMDNLDARDPKHTADVIAGVVEKCNTFNAPMEALLIHVYRAGMVDALSYLLMRTPENKSPGQN